MATKLKHDPFKTAVAAAPRSKLEKGTTWLIDDGTPDGADIAVDIGELNRLAAELKETTTKLDACKDRLKTYATEQWLYHWATLGAMPPAPVRLADPLSGESCNWVVQDRSASFAPADDALAALDVELGESVVEAYLRESTTYSFDPTILALRARDPMTEKRSTIQAMIAMRIAPLLEQLVADDEIEPWQAKALMTVETTRVFDAGFIGRLPELCGRDAGRLGRAVAALGSAIVRFVKPA
jgi:hypothetical protein